MEDMEKLKNISSILREKEMIEGDELRMLLQGTKEQDLAWVSPLKIIDNKL